MPLLDVLPQLLSPSSIGALPGLGLRMGGTGAAVASGVQALHRRSRADDDLPGLIRLLLKETKAARREQAVYYEKSLEALEVMREATLAKVGQHSGFRFRFMPLPF